MIILITAMKFYAQKSAAYPSRVNLEGLKRKMFFFLRWNDNFCFKVVDSLKSLNHCEIILFSTTALILSYHG